MLTVLCLMMHGSNNPYGTEPDTHDPCAVTQQGAAAPNPLYLGSAAFPFAPSVTNSGISSPAAVSEPKPLPKGVRQNNPYAVTEPTAPDVSV